jgi:hypothetical protein
MVLRAKRLGPDDDERRASGDADLDILGGPRLGVRVPL